MTLSPGMGEYLDMANNAKANPAAGTAANENYAREVMQLFSLGDVLLNQDGTRADGCERSDSHLPPDQRNRTGPRLHRLDLRARARPAA